MNPRLVGAIAAILVLGGGSVAFVVWRAAAERADRIRGLQQEVAAELAIESEDRDLESLRLLLRRVRATRAEVPDRLLDLAEGRILLELGRSQDAWELVRPLATVPGAGADALEIGSRIVARLHAETGDEAHGRQALAMAAEHARQTGSLDSRRLAWQLAYRIADIDRWVSLSVEIAESGDRPDSDLVKATAGVLAGFIADRTGIGQAALGAGDGGPAGELARARALSATPAPVELLDELLARYARPPVELEIVASFRLLDEYGGLEGDAIRGSHAEDLLADASARIDVVLTRDPSSVDARNLAVIAAFGMQASFGLDDAARERCRSQLEWLLSSAPRTHVQRAVWERLAAAFRR